MHLKPDHVERFQKWLRNGITDESYLFVRMSGSRRCVVYGAGSPQLLTLSMCAAVDAAAKLKLIEWMGDAPGYVVHDVIESFIKGDHKSKTIFTQASNYWLKDLSKYSGQKTKALTGSVQGVPKDMKDKKLLQNKDKGEAEVSRIIEENTEAPRGEFYERFDKSPFNIEDIIGEGPDRFERMGNKGREKTTHGKPMKLSDLVFDAAIRRSCKFLIYDTIRQKMQIVYLLDDLDLTKIAYLVKRGQAIPEDSRLRTGSSEGKVPICTTEIRELFRNWDYLSAHVSFYKDFEACDAPWGASNGQEKAWALYGAHRAEKILGSKLASKGDAEQLQACIDQVGQGAWAAAIKSYHLGNPSRYGKGASLHTVTTEAETL